MTFNRDKDFALGERRTGKFRKKFRPIPEDLDYTFRMYCACRVESCTQSGAADQSATSASAIAIDLRMTVASPGGAPVAQSHRLQCARRCRAQAPQRQTACADCRRV